MHEKNICLEQEFWIPKRCSAQELICSKLAASSDFGFSISRERSMRPDMAANEARMSWLAMANAMHALVHALAFRLLSGFYLLDEGGAKKHFFPG